MTTKTTCNPGCVDPASQSFSPPPVAREGSPRVSRRLPVTSNGEIQTRSGVSTVNGTASSSPGSAAVTQSTGEAQRRDLRQAELAETTCLGLPSNVSAGTTHPGGLPADIVVK